jgi:hypothetical protein
MPDPSTEQNVLTIVPDKDTDLADAIAIATRQQAAGLISQWRPAVGPQGIAVILTSASNSRAVAQEYQDAGFQVISLPQ